MTAYILFLSDFSKHNHEYSVEREMLYYASVTKGQCLMIQMNGRTEIRRAAMDCFVQACLYVS